MKIAKLILLVGVLAVAVSGSPVSAFADQMQTFDFSGTFYQSADTTITGSFSGTVTIDTTLGDLVSASFTDPYQSASGSCAGTSECYPSTPGTLEGWTTGIGYVLGAEFPVQFALSISQSTLVGITNLTAVSNGDNFGFFLFNVSSAADPDCGGSVGCYISTLTITPAVSTPEPSSILLLAIGLLGLVGLRRRGRASAGVFLRFLIFRLEDSGGRLSAAVPVLRFVLS